jgi:coproporphyrinogen dehydrogenase HemZ
MIILSTATPLFFNDICEVIRLFYGIVPIMPPGDRTGDDDAKTAINHEVTFNGDNQIHTFSIGMPDGNPALRHSETFYPMHGINETEFKRELKRCIKAACFRLLKQHTAQIMPWGSLTGIRPTRLLRDLMREGATAEAACQVLVSRFDCSEQKASLTLETARNQQAILDSVHPGDLDIYIGIPFCASKCLYCSFGSTLMPRDRSITAIYIDELIGEIQSASEAILPGRRIRSLYIGGGTPTALDMEELDTLQEAVSRYFPMQGCEYTLEAGRPDSLDRSKLRLVRSAGANRISINPQSMNAKTLGLIGRCHTPEQIPAAVGLARAEGFDFINMDIIAGLPGETPDDFQHTLESVLEFKPENLTVHTLAVKRASRLRLEMDKFTLPGLTDVERMLDSAYLRAKENGMQPYYLYRQKYMSGNLENVGYAMPDRECLYNIDIMEEKTDILALGAGAISKRIFREGRIERLANPKDLKTYMENSERLAREKARFFSE